MGKFFSYLGILIISSVALLSLSASAAEDGDARLKRGEAAMIEAAFTSLHHAHGTPELRDAAIQRWIRAKDYIELLSPVALANAADIFEREGEEELAMEAWIVCVGKGNPAYYRLAALGLERLGAGTFWGAGVYQMYMKDQLHKFMPANFLEAVWFFQKIEDHSTAVNILRQFLRSNLPATTREDLQKASMRCNITGASDLETEALMMSIGEGGRCPLKVHHVQFAARAFKKLGRLDLAKGAWETMAKNIIFCHADREEATRQLERLCLLISAD